MLLQAFLEWVLLQPLGRLVSPFECSRLVGLIAIGLSWSWTKFWLLVCIIHRQRSFTRFSCDLLIQGSVLNSNDRGFRVVCVRFCPPQEAKANNMDGYCWFRKLAIFFLVNLAFLRLVWEAHSFLVTLSLTELSFLRTPQKYYEVEKLQRVGEVSGTFALHSLNNAPRLIWVKLSWDQSSSCFPLMFSQLSQGSLDTGNGVQRSSKLVGKCFWHHIWKK